MNFHLILISILCVLISQVIGLISLLYFSPKTMFLQLSFGIGFGLIGFVLLALVGFRRLRRGFWVDQADADK